LQSWKNKSKGQRGRGTRIQQGSVDRRKKWQKKHKKELEKFMILGQLTPCLENGSPDGAYGKCTRGLESGKTVRVTFISNRCTAIVGQ